MAGRRRRARAMTASPARSRTPGRHRLCRDTSTPRRTSWPPRSSRTRPASSSRRRGQLQGRRGGADWTGARNFAASLIDLPGESAWPIVSRDLHPAAEGSEGSGAGRRSHQVLRLGLQERRRHAEELDYIPLPAAGAPTRCAQPGRPRSRAPTASPSTTDPRCRPGAQARAFCHAQDVAAAAHDRRRHAGIDAASPSPLAAAGATAPAPRRPDLPRPRCWRRPLRARPARPDHRLAVPSAACRPSSIRPRLLLDCRLEPGDRDLRRRRCRSTARSSPRISP